MVTPAASIGHVRDRLASTPDYDHPRLLRAAIRNGEISDDQALALAREFDADIEDDGFTTIHPVFTAAPRPRRSDIHTAGSSIEENDDGASAQDQGT